MWNILKTFCIVFTLPSTYRRVYQKSIRPKTRQTNFQSGQAVFEYVLMLVVTLSLIVGLSIHFIKPLGDYLKHNVGSYIQCLLETGQLPFILVANPSNECDLEDLKAESIAGSGSTGTVGGGSSSSGSQSTGDSDSDSNRSGNNRGGSDSGNNSGSSGGSGSGNNGLTQNRSGALNETGGGSGAGGGGGGGGPNRGQKLVAKINNEGGDGIQRGQSAFYKFEQDMGRGISGAIPTNREPEEQKLESMRNPPEPPKTKRDTQVEGLRKSGFSAQMPAPQRAAGLSNENVDMGLNLGKYIRYLIIGGIVFALCLMVFLQLNSLRKSMSGGD